MKPETRIERKPMTGDEILRIRPEGATSNWEFSIGSYCGKAVDSLSVSFKGMEWNPSLKRHAIIQSGGVLTREDAMKLRDYLNSVAEFWEDNPPIPLREMWAMWAKIVKDTDAHNDSLMEGRER